MGASKVQKAARLPIRIYTHRQLSFASRAVSQAVNGRAAHDWGQVLMFEGKSCSPFWAFTRCQERFSCGKLGESSDKSVPMIGNLAESSDKVETMELIALQKRTLLRQWMKICLASFLWKSDLFFSHESDGGNRVRTFTGEKFG